jgi:hypothetical protein
MERLAAASKLHGLVLQSGTDEAIGREAGTTDRRLSIDSIPYKR